MSPSPPGDRTPGEKPSCEEAAEQGHANVVGLLLEAKADVHHTFDAGLLYRWCMIEFAGAFCSHSDRGLRHFW